ncbi:MAG: redoxin domain-containing protein [Bacteroidota bacterium]
MKSQLLFLYIICCFLACQQSTSNNTTIAKAGFVANPQPLEKREVKTLQIGESAPDFNLPDIDGHFRQLSDFTKDVLVVIFTCNHCPTAQAYEDRIKAIVTDYGDKSVDLVAITPNSPLGLRYDELGYTDLNDDFSTMKPRAEHHNFNFPYLYDGDTEAASLQYGPVATPHAFVFDKARKLQYVGRLDKVENPSGGANAEDLRRAIDEVLAGQPVTTSTTKTFGCSTKWAWKTDYNDKADADWAARPVTLENIDEVGVKALLKNEDSGKLRLINVWATWCGPCVMEYPEFVILQRMYGNRDFEFVSISADKPNIGDKVLKVLKEKQSAVKNYHFSEDDKYALIEAVDPNWNGALPYTVLVEPNGKVVWSYQGDVDFLELKRAIVDHSMIGRYF